MKKFAIYTAILALLVSVAVSAQTVDTTAGVTTTNTSVTTDTNASIKFPGNREGAIQQQKERIMEARTKMEEKLKERAEKVKTNSSESKTFDVACAQTAVDARDTTIISAFDTFSVSMKTALETRKVAVKAAWSQPTADERNAARKAANQTYNTSAKTVHRELHVARKTAWDTHKSDMKKCGASAGTDAMMQVSGGLSL